MNLRLCSHRIRANGANRRDGTGNCNTTMVGVVGGALLGCFLETVAVAAARLISKRVGQLHVELIPDALQVIRLVDRRPVIKHHYYLLAGLRNKSQATVRG